MMRNGHERKSDHPDDRYYHLKQAVSLSLTYYAMTYAIVPFVQNKTYDLQEKYMTHSVADRLAGRAKMKLDTTEGELANAVANDQNINEQREAKSILADYTANTILYAIYHNGEVKDEIDRQFEQGELDWRTPGLEHALQVDEDVLSQRSNISAVSDIDGKPVKISVYYSQDRPAGVAERSRTTLDNSGPYTQEVDVSLVDYYTGEERGYIEVRREVGVSPEGGESKYATLVVNTGNKGNTMVSNKTSFKFTQEGVERKVEDSTMISGVQKGTMSDKAEGLMHDIRVVGDALDSVRVQK